MARIDIDVDLNDFDLDEILDFVIDTLSDGCYQQKMARLKQELGIEKGIKIESLDDELKIEHIKKIFNKYTTDFIEQQLPC